MKPTILIIDDDREFLDDFTLLLSEKFNCFTVTSGKEGLKILNENNPDVILLDLMLNHGENGLDILKRIQSEDENIPVIMVTDYASIDTAVEAMRLGAFDYISKTPNMKELSLLIQKAIKNRLRFFQTRFLQQEVSTDYYQIVGKSAAIEDVNRKIHLSARNLNTVLISGESGVGKELVARQIHLKSDRASCPFVAINCAAIPAELLESELFGHEKGAFTGATKRKPGKFEIATNGIIFFDEISELTLQAQVKLLRVLQEKEFIRVGGQQTIRTDAKIIAASNCDLREMVDSGHFREDLYYRLDVIPIKVPPLRNRKEDLPLLIDFFLDKTCKEMKINKKSFTPAVYERFKKYNWPGNIRELRNYITRAVILCQGDTIDEHHLDSGNMLNTDSMTLTLEGSVPMSWEEMDLMRRAAAEKASREIERRFLKYVLDNHDGNISRAAIAAGMNRTNFHKMMKRCGL